jgi:peroxiredoxin
VNFAILLIPVSAQDDDLSQSKTSISGRITIHFPDGWVASDAVLTDVQTVFASDALSVATSEDALNSLNLGVNNVPGSHIVIANFTVLDVYPLNPAPQDYGEVWGFLFGPDNPDVQLLEVSGYPAARIDQPNNVSITLVGMEASILSISSQATQESEAATVRAIIDSLQITPPDDNRDAAALVNPIGTSDARVTFNTGQGWYFGTRGPIIYASPLASPVQDFTFQLTDFGPMQAPFFAVLPVSYGEFLQPNQNPTPDDLRVMLDSTLGRFEAFPAGEHSALEVAGFPALQVPIELGANSGTALAVDAVHTVYVLVSLFPPEDAALAEALMQTMTVQALSPEVAALPAEGLREGFRAPNFSTTLLDGSPVSLSDLRGKVVMLNFWFTTCPPCQTEMPAMQVAYDQYREQGFDILAVNNAELPHMIHPFMDGLNLNFPVALDTARNIQQQYGIFNYPSTYFVDRDGIIFAIQLGPLDIAQLDQIIQDELTSN